jgi:hypothetical protein
MSMAPRTSAPLPTCLAEHSLPEILTILNLRFGSVTISAVGVPADSNGSRPGVLR